MKAEEVKRRALGTVEGMCASFLHPCQGRRLALAKNPGERGSTSETEPALALVLPPPTPISPQALVTPPDLLQQAQPNQIPTAQS